jgi:hypothetical protein
MYPCNGLTPFGLSPFWLIFVIIMYPCNDLTPFGLSPFWLISLLAYLAVPPRERDWWSCLWEKILSPFPNCNAVENRPSFTC